MVVIRYTDNWDLISRFIRFYRARNKCEFCQVENYAIGYWIGEGFITWEEAQLVLNTTGKDLYKDVPFDKKEVKIVLTVAHLDHDILNNSFFNLAALCQRCHLNHDRRDNIKRRRKKRFYKQLKLQL